MQRFDSRTLGIIGIVSAAVLFVAVNVVSNTWLRNLRLDVTEGASYSTSAQVKPMFASIKEPIVVRVYFSEAIGRASPRHAEYFQRVRDLLQQYAELANGKIKVELYNPEPFSDVEDRAVGFGLQAVPLGQLGEVGYFGLAATNSTDDQQVIPFFNLERAQFLEYDLAKLIYSLSEPDQPKIGLLSTLPIEGAPAMPNMMGMPQQQPRPWAVLGQIRDTFAIETLNPGITAIPADIDILMLVQPDGLSDAAAYAIDQFILRGGKALVFVDPNAESAGMGGPPGGGDKQGINKLLTAWGVRMVDGQVVGDLEAAARVGIQAEGRPVAADYVAWLQLRAGHFDTSDAITGDLQQINLGTSGVLEKVEGATTTVTPLISTGLQSMRMPADKFIGLPDVVTLFREFKPQNKAEILAARISGPAKSAFAEAPKGEGIATAPHLSESKQPIQVVVVADTDILGDRFWTQNSSFLGEQVVVPTADNANFVINALENLTGSPALSALRGRGVKSRPFELLESIRRDAEMQYRQTEQSLTGRLEELQKKVSAMQVREDGQGQAILSDEDQRTIESYRGDILATRRELREVQRALREDIDRLQGILTFVNIAVVPILFGLGLIVFAAVRRRRRRRSAAA
ncbi:MAG: Gldg family protein [Proteobacteria bacterium]|nr:Gldg family protein [Pseudomonadota bacterium]